MLNHLSEELQAIIIYINRMFLIQTMKWSEWTDKLKKQKEQSKSNKDNTTEYEKKEKSINLVIKDGFFTSIKTGFTESFIMPYAIALNASTGMLAALGSVPQLVASFFQLFSQESLGFFNTRIRLLFWTAFIQAFMWLPLLFIPFIAKDHVWLVLLFVTLEATIGTFQGPIYNSVLGDLIKEDKRGEFFGRRNRIVNLVNFISTFVAGFIINAFQKLDNGEGFYLFFGFGILFIVAFAARLTAAYYKRRFYDAPFTPSKNKTSFIGFIRNMTHNNYGIFVTYVFLFKFAASISMPFFALYLLKDLHLGYVYFTIITGISIAASLLAMTLWGRMIDKHGSKRALTISGFLVPFMPILMIPAIFIKDPLHIFLYLLVEEIISGISWAGFNLSTSSFIFDATSKDERIKYISYYNFLIGIGIFLGAIVGGLLINVFPIWIVSSLPYVFLTSGILRFLATALLIRKVREARMVEIDFPGRGFFHTAISINPRYGSNIEIIAAYDKPKHKAFHNILSPKRTPVDPVKKEERKLYENKSLEYYRQNSLKTMQKQSEETKKDDSDKIEKDIEEHKRDIAKITEDIKKKNLK